MTGGAVASEGACLVMSQTDAASVLGEELGKIKEKKRKKRRRTSWGIRPPRLSRWPTMRVAQGVRRLVLKL